ncbi:MAG: V-type ATPase 116kDa subunit family protein [Treponema sp.]|nr:V-type ATPase 116kDa subunit family protein [Treponema sp.]
MARTTEMRLVELMALKQDVQNVILYLGKNGNFQFQTKKRSVQKVDDKKFVNIDTHFFDCLQKTRAFFNIPDISDSELKFVAATDDDRDKANKIIAATDEFEKNADEKSEKLRQITETLKEAESFSNLKIPYSQLEHLSFLSLRIGRIPADNFESLREAVGFYGVVIPLGNDKSKILAATSKKGRFALDTELKKFGFVNMEIPENFNGIPEEVLVGMQQEKVSAERDVAKINEEKKNYADTHSDEVRRLLGAFCISKQIKDIQNGLESTSMVYRLTGWIPAADSRNFMKELDDLTEGRIAIREYLPTEVPSVLRGEEKVPVKLTHGKFISAFERMIFSYGSPLYGTIDPTPFVAIFFTFLFGIMFGDFGQGLVIFLAGLLMAKKVIKVGTWNKFAPIFMGVGCSSCLMGLITGEFFGTEEILEPFALFVTGLFGNPHAPILKVMPSSNPNSILVIFGIFAVTIAFGFIINSIGLIVNMCNNALRKKFGNVFFGKCGFFGLLFYWYVVAFALRIAAFHHLPAVYDWVIIGVSLFFAAFGEPFERLFNGDRPVVENGFGSLVIGGIVELIEVVSSYLSSTLSFVRVGAFALAHAVLGFIIELMSSKCGPVGGIFVLVAGNAIVVVLEGMIVAIQVIRLQYYEFFSKFFNETGAEFKPLQFHYI